MKKYFLILISIAVLGCQQSAKTIEKPFVVEITTFKYKPSVNVDNFWNEDAKIQENYTSKQQGFISRESGYSEDKKEVLVVVYWESNSDAKASMKKFMQDNSVVDFVNMIDQSSMKMARYTVK